MTDAAAAATDPRGEACLVFSTGRCATQWLADRLMGIDATASATANTTVVHEAWQDHALTRRLIAMAGNPHAVRAEDKLLAHAERIEAALTQGRYVETGFPIWPALPWLTRRLQGRVRIVHLTRHPVTTALSWLSHGAWQPPLLPHLPAGRVLIEADDAGVIHPEYRARWAQLAPYDKALFHWAEVHAAALRLEAQADFPWLRLRFEDLFSAAGGERLAAFLNVPAERFGRQARQQRVDAWHSLIMTPVHWRDIARHPAVLALCDPLGYDPMAVDLDALRARFGPAVSD